MTHDHIELGAAGGGPGWPVVALLLGCLAVGLSVRASARARGRAPRAAHLVMGLAMVPMLVPGGLLPGASSRWFVEGAVGVLVAGAGLVALGALRRSPGAGWADCLCSVDLLGMAAVLVANTQGVVLTVVVAGVWVAVSVIAHAVTVRVSGAVAALAAALAMAVMTIGPAGL